VNQPTVSIVIPLHNGADTIVEQLTAVARAQVVAPPSEILVIDNRSTDGSREVVQAWADRNSTDVRIISANERAGEPYARNVGLVEAAGQFIVYCDADDRVDPTWIRGLVELLEDGEYATGPIDMHAMNPSWIATIRGTSVTGRSMMLDEVPYAHGCNMGFRRDSLLTIGGFDERYTAGCDLDIAVRMWEAGHELRYGEDAAISYRLRPSLRSTYAQGIFYGRYRVPILARLAAHGFVAPDRRIARVVWLIRHIPFAAFRRRVRARWTWVAAQLIGEHRGSKDRDIIDLTRPSELTHVACKAS